MQIDRTFEIQEIISLCPGLIVNKSFGKPIKNQVDLIQHLKQFPKEKDHLKEPILKLMREHIDLREEEKLLELFKICQRFDLKLKLPEIVELGVKQILEELILLQRHPLALDLANYYPDPNKKIEMLQWIEIFSPGRVNLQR